MADLRIVDAPVLLQESITDDVKMPTGGLGNYAIRLGDLVWYVVNKGQLASKSYVDNSSKGVQDKLDDHIDDKNNPHQVTKEQVGLGAVNNTADVDKPVSNATRSAINTATNDMATKTYVNQQNSLKADKATTLTSYGIIDAYTKTETDNKINALSSTTYAGHKGYATLALAQASQTTLAANTLVEITNDTDSTKNGVYLWDGTTLTKSVHDPLNQARSYIDAKTILREDVVAASIEDKAGSVIAYFDTSAKAYFANDLIIKGKSLTASITEQNNQVRFNSILSVRSKVKSLIPVATKSEDGLIKRMPSCIKTPTGLVYFYHKQISGYDGDNTGSELWKAIINIDTNLNVTVVSRELFLAPDEPRGIVKHPMLGRTSDNRIILMYEKRLETTDKYIRYQCYSSDEGVTFTTPTVVSPLGLNPAGTSNSALGTTGKITTARNGRLIVPMYTVGGACYCIYSDDDGVTWTYSAWVDTTKVKGNEPSISLDLDDNLVMDVRPQTAGYRLKAKSVDNGETWQAMSTQQVPSASNQGVIFRDKSLGLMIQANNAEQSNSRLKYSLFLSYDNCATFPFVYMPFAPTWYGGYSQIIKWADGIYIIAIEYADTFISVNNNENAGLLILSLSEVLANVSSN